MTISSASSPRALAALRAALIAGERSGKPEPFDAEVLLAEVKADDDAKS